MNRILVTGFEAFDGYKINPSAEVARSLDGLVIGQFQVTGKVLPLSYETGFQHIKDLVTQIELKYIISCGQAPRASISLERIAVNALDITRPDNEGKIPDSDIIIPEAPAGYFSTIDPHPIVNKLREMEIPSFVSYDAGTYGCNWLLFNVLHWLKTTDSKIKTIFVHLPPLPSQVFEKQQYSLATMTLETQVKALRIIIESLE